MSHTKIHRSGSNAEWMEGFVRLLRDTAPVVLTSVDTLHTESVLVFPLTLFRLHTSGPRRNGLSRTLTMVSTVCDVVSEAD